MTNTKFQIKTKILNTKYQILIGLFVYSFICLFPNHVFAENIGLGVYPPIIQIDATPPTDIHSPMTISNESDTPLDVHIVVRPFTQNTKDNGEPQYLTPGQRIGDDPHIFDKMAIFDGTKNTSDITLAPSQKKNIELRITLPTGEPPGDYYFSITMLSKPIEIGHNSGSQIAGGISTNVLLSIGPKDKPTGFIQNFSSPLFVDHGPVPFSVLVANTSKHFIVPQGTILIKNMFGQIIGKISLSQENILAGTSRYLLDDGASSVLQTPHPSAVWGEKFLLGPYSATLTVALSGEGPLYVRKIYFFALPIQVLIGIILSIILIGIIVYRVRKQLR